MVSEFGQGPSFQASALVAELVVGDALPPPTRAAALMALLGIALLGMLIVAVILLGGHWVRRQGNFRRGRAVPPDRPLLEREASSTAGSNVPNSDASPISDDAGSTRDTRPDVSETRLS